MTYAVGRGVRVEVSTVEGAPKTVTAITAAKPPVATSAAHGLTAKSLAYMNNVVGMPQLEGQAVRLNPVTTNDFTLEDLDATSYGTFVSGTAVPITTLQTLVSSTGYNKAGGDPNPLEITVLLDEINQQVNGPLAAETVTFTGRVETISSTAMAAVRAAARTGAYLVFRLTLKDGNVRFFRGQPAIPTEQLDQGAVGSYSFSVTVRQFVCEGVA